MAVEAEPAMAVSPTNALGVAKLAPHAAPAVVRFPLTSHFAQSLVPGVEASMLTNLVVLPDRVPTAVACPPWPMTGKLLVSAAALVVHVGQANVLLEDKSPPPVSGAVVEKTVVPFTFEA